jgi:hypothetical protein
MKLMKNTLLKWGKILMKKSQKYILIGAAVVILPLAVWAQGYQGLIAPQAETKKQGQTTTGGYAGLIAGAPTSNRPGDPKAPANMQEYMNRTTADTVEGRRENMRRQLEENRKKRLDDFNARVAADQEAQRVSAQQRLEALQKKQAEEAANGMSR